jgi:hypothetical protein
VFLISVRAAEERFQMRTGIQGFLQFLKSIFVCDSCSEMNDNNEHGMVESPLKETVASLSRTPKGQIVYDRVPLLPINQSTSSRKSGVLLSEDIFNRNPVFPEKSVDSQQFPHEPTLHNSSMSLNNRSGLFIDFPVQHTEKRINQFKWTQELLLMRNTNQLDETTPVYNLSNHMIMQMFELREAQRLVSKQFLLASMIIFLYLKSLIHFSC